MASLKTPFHALILRRARSQKVGVALAFLFLCSSSRIHDAEGSISIDQEVMTPLPVYGGSAIASIAHRKPNDRRYHNKVLRSTRELAHINVEDYPRFDPVPSSKTIHAGPIEHGTPLMPYIPRPTPPNHPKHGSP